MLQISLAAKKAMSLDQSIFDFLRAKVDHTREDYFRAREDFWKIAAEAPSGLPNADGSRRVENAARAQTATMVSYAKALRQFNEFLLDGTVPEELLPEKNPQRKSAASEKGDSDDKSTRKAGS
jgi:hypothetical protein